MGDMHRLDLAAARVAKSTVRGAVSERIMTPNNHFYSTFFFRKALLTMLSKHFNKVELHLLVGHFTAIIPDLFSNTLVWRCQKRER